MFSHILGKERSYMFFLILSIVRTNVYIYIWSMLLHHGGCSVTGLDVEDSSNNVYLHTCHWFLYAIMQQYIKNV